MFRNSSITSRQAICLGLLIALLCSAYYSMHRPFAHSTRALSNWFDDEGLLEWDRAAGFATTYTTFDMSYSCDSTFYIGDTPACRSGLKLLTALSGNMQAQQTYLSNPSAASDLADTSAIIAPLRGKRILIAGDSTDRNSFEHLIAMLSSRPFMPVHPVFGAAAASIPIASAIDDIVSAADLADAFEIAPLTASEHFRIDQVFLVGTLNDHEIDGYGPPEPAVRLGWLAGEVGARRDGAAVPVYDAVYINAGLWDMAAIQRQLLTNDRDDPYPGLLPAQLLAYEAGLTKLVATTRDMFPGAAIIMRTLHDTNSTLFAGPAHPDDNTGIEHQHTFKSLRAFQMRQAQIRVAKKTGVGLNPFGLRMLGQGDITTDSVHPNIQANMVHLEMMLRHLIEL